MLKTCITCKQDKPLSAFSKHKAKPDGLQTRCKECNKAQYQRVRDKKAAYYKETRADRLAYGKARRARLQARTDAEIAEAIQTAFPDGIAPCKAGHTAPVSDFRLNKQCLSALSSACREHDDVTYKLIRSAVDLWEDMDVFGCWYCGGPFEHVDHVHALALGGTDHPENLRPSCAKCNLNKNAMPREQWFARLR